jgi:hypothetical protein
MSAVLRRIEKVYSARDILEATGRRGEATVSRWVKEGLLASPLMIGGRRTWTEPQVAGLLQALRRKDAAAVQADGLDLARAGRIFRRLQRAALSAMERAGVDAVGRVLREHGSSSGALREIPPSKREAATRALGLVSP